jgi:hypothetical protein
MLHDRGGKRKAETGAGIEAFARQSTRSVTVTRSLPIADLPGWY